MSGKTRSGGDLARFRGASFSWLFVGHVNQCLLTSCESLARVEPGALDAPSWESHHWPGEPRNVGKANIKEL